MKPSVMIELDKPRNIRLTTNALIKLEELLGKPITEIGTSFGIKEIRAMLWTGLIHEDKQLTIEEVGEMMDEAGFEYVTGKVVEAMNLALGIKPVTEEPDPNR